jgi:uncharacterized membrane protein YgdD (TMEM256/DUF423 family)
MIRAWLIAAALGGFLSVAAGAAAAHLPAGERGAELLRTGALYGMVHGAALIAVTAMARFSLSLFALALSGREWLGMITPFGGAGLLVGWAALAFHGSSQR